MNKRQKYLRDVNWNSLEKLLKFESCIVIWVCNKKAVQSFLVWQRLSLIYQIALSDSRKITFGNWILVKGSVSTLLDLCLIVKNIVYCSILLHVIPAAVISCKSLSSSSSWYCYLLSSLSMKGRVRSNGKRQRKIFLSSSYMYVYVCDSCTFSRYLPKHIL